MLSVLRERDELVHFSLAVCCRFVHVGRLFALHCICISGAQCVVLFTLVAVTCRDISFKDCPGNDFDCTLPYLDLSCDESGTVSTIKYDDDQYDDDNGVVRNHLLCFEIAR